jgi:hypothetical protein
MLSRITIRVSIAATALTAIATVAVVCSGCGRAKETSEAKDVQDKIQQLQTLRSQLDENIRQAGLRERARQYEIRTPIVPKVIDRTTGAGEREYREQQLLLPLLQAQQKAEIEAAVASAEAAEARKQKAAIEEIEKAIGKGSNRKLW